MAASSNLDPKVLGLLKRHQQAVEKVAGILEQYYNKLKDSPLAELPTEEVTRLSLRNFAVSLSSIIFLVVPHNLLCHYPNRNGNVFKRLHCIWIKLIDFHNRHGNYANT